MCEKDNNDFENMNPEDINKEIGEADDINESYEVYETEEPLEDYLDEECDAASRRKKKIKIIGGIGLGVLGMGATAYFGGKYVKANPEKIAGMTKMFRKIPAKEIRQTIGTAGKEAAETVHEVGKEAAETVTDWMTNTDKKKLAHVREYLPEGLGDGIIEGSMYQLQNGYTTVDQFAKEWGAAKALRGFKKWWKNIDNISDSEIARAIEEAAKETYGVDAVKVFDKAAEIRVRSNSGKSHWNAFLDFKKLRDGVTEYSSPYDNSSVMRAFYRNVMKRLKYIAED